MLNIAFIIKRRKSIGMFRKLIIITGLLSVVFIAFGQKNKKAQKHPNSDAPLYTTTQDGQQQYYNETGAPLPPVNIWRRDGKFLKNENLKNDAHLFMMLFNPTCEHCENMTIAFKNNIQLFKKSRLVLVAAPGMESYLDFFIKNTGTENVPKIEIGIDSSGFINQTFLYKSLPQINVYNKDRKLEKIFFGDVPIDSLREYIE